MARLVAFGAYLKHKVSVLYTLQSQVFIVEVSFQAGEELILSVDVCGQDQGAQLLFNILSASTRTKEKHTLTKQIPLRYNATLVLCCPFILLLL